MMIMGLFVYFTSLYNPAEILYCALDAVEEILCGKFGYLAKRGLLPCY